MKNFFVIGDKASKSLSPLIFNHWFKKYNIQAKYSFLEVTKKNFDTEIVKKISDKKTQGFNVTIPFKKDIIKHLDNKNIHAQKIGAVNCVTGGNFFLGFCKFQKQPRLTRGLHILAFLNGLKKLFYPSQYPLLHLQF